MHGPTQKAESFKSALRPKFSLYSSTITIPDIFVLVLNFHKNHSNISEFKEASSDSRLLDMAKERSDRSKEERKASKKVKKEAALGPTESAGVVKSSSDKAEKKEKKGKREALAERALNEIGTAQKQTEEDESDTGEEGDGPGIEADGMAKGESGKGKGKEKRSFVLTRPTGALVPFANPLAVEEKTVKKIFKSVKKGKWT